MRKHSIWYEGQYGFRKNRSCSDAINDFIGNIVEGIDQNQHTIAVFLDMSKLFDTIKHSVLFEKLHNCGIRGVALNWFKSYLTDRKLIVRFDNTDSDVYNVEYGTAQGSVLGPILYNFFTNNLTLQLKFSHCICFADDTTIFIRGANLNFMKKKLRDDLARVSTYFKKHRLTLNLDKMCLMLFSKNINDPVNINFNGITISQVESTRFLGVIIDQKLTWNQHVTYIL